MFKFTHKSTVLTLIFPPKGRAMLTMYEGTALMWVESPHPSEAVAAFTQHVANVFDAAGVA